MALSHDSLNLFWVLSAARLPHLFPSYASSFSWACSVLTCSPGGERCLGILPAAILANLDDSSSLPFSSATGAGRASSVR